MEFAITMGLSMFCVIWLYAQVGLLNLYNGTVEELPHEGNPQSCF